MSDVVATATVLSVVIPAYNEEDGIAECVERVLAVRPALAEIGLGLEVVVVDDGSKDRTAEIVQGYVDQYSEVCLVCHNPNRGYGAALKTGFAAGCGDLLAFLDADGTYPPASLPDLCREALSGADLVVGSRRSGGEWDAAGTQSGNFVWANLVTALSGKPVLDPARACACSNDRHSIASIHCRMGSTSRPSCQPEPFTRGSTLSRSLCRTRSVADDRK